MSNKNFILKNILLLTGATLLLTLAYMKPVSAEAPSPPRGSATFYSSGTINFRPIEFKIDNVSEVTSIEWINRPDNINDLLYTFKSDDGVNYRLEGFPAYNGILSAGLTTVELLITGINSSSINLTIPVVVVTDEAPLISITSTGPLEYNKGHHSQVAVQMNDPGRNIISVRALLYSTGDNQNALAEIGKRTWEKFIGSLEYIDYDTWDWFSHNIYEAQAKTNDDLINYRLPVYVNQNVNTGSYDLRVEVKDSKGNVTLSEPLTVNVSAPATPPRLTVTAPDYRIPAGQSYTLKYVSEHLDRLDRIEFVQSGPVGNNVTKTVSFVDGEYTQNGQILLNIPDLALEGQTFTVTATVYDVNGSSKALNVQVDVGLWGERTVIFDSLVQTYADERFQFANVVIPSYETLLQADPNIQYNNLTIEENASIKISSGSLHVNGDLIIAGEIAVPINQSYRNKSEYKVSDGQHGGDSDETGFAYDDFRDPKYPGSNYGSYQFTGGKLNISAGSINLQSTGSITANGTYNSHSGGGVIIISSPTAVLNGLVTALGYNRAGGGSVLVKTNSLSGTATIDTSSNNNLYSAGGRIAIYYDTYSDTTVSPIGGITFLSQTNQVNGNGGAGTIFLKRPDQTYGDLHIDNGGKFNPFGNLNFTSLETLGKHIVSNVELVSGTTDQYKVTVQGKPWQIKNKYGWDSGVKGKHISLNSADKSSPVYEVVDEVIATDGIDVLHTGSITPAGEIDSVKLIPLTLSQDEELYFDLSFQGNFGGKLFIFKDSDSNGVVATSDLVTGGEFDSPTQEFNPFKKITLTAGDYIIGVSRKFVSAGEAVLGQSNANQTCNNCTFSLSIKSVNTDSLIIHSATPPVFTPGNELIGVVRINHLTVSTGSRLRGADRIHSDTFDIAEEKAIENILDIISSTPNIFTTLDATTQNAFYIGDVTADTVMLGDGFSLTVYGDLNITNDLLVQSTPPGYGAGPALSSSLNVKNISVGGNITINDTPLEIQTDGVITAANLSVLSNSSITVPFADSVKKKLYSLNMNVSGKITVDASSSIDLTGKGYPANTGLGFIYNNSFSYVGHGGKPNNERAIYQYGPYGDYANALFAGAGGYNGVGGGFARIQANELLLNGSIIVDGVSYNSAGGGLNIKTNIFNGSGRISATGGRNPNSAYPASGGRISIIAGIDDFTSVGSAINTGKYENSSGSVSYSGHEQYLSAAGTTYITTSAGQPGHLIVDNTYNGLSQLASTTTPLRSVGRQTISNIEALPNNEYRITVVGTPWQERVTNPDNLGLIGLKVDLNAYDEAGELLEIIDGTENTIIVTSAIDITSAIGQELIGVITLDKVSVLGGAILEINDRLILTSPELSEVDSSSKLITTQISELSALGLASSPSMGEIEFTDKTTLTNLNVTSANLNFPGGLELTTLGMTGGKLRVSTLNITDALINNGTIEAINLNVSNNLDLISGGKITVIPQTSRSDLWEDDVHYSLNINVAGTFNIDIDSSVDVNSRGYKYEGPERIGEYSIVNGDMYNSNFWWRFASGCHGGTSIYSHRFFLNSNPDEKYQTCEYGSYRQAQYAGLPAERGSRDYEVGYGGGFVQITAGSLNHFGQILANGLVNIANSNYYIGSAGGGIHIAVDNISGNGAIEARGASDDTHTYDGYFVAGAGGRISAHIALNNTYTGPMDAGPGLNTFVGNSSGSPGTVYVKNPGEIYGNLTIDNFSRQTTTTIEADFPKTNIPSVGRHKIRDVVNLGNNQWRLDTENNTLFESYSDSVTATGPGSIKVYNFTLTESKTIQVQMENLTSNYIVYLFKDDGSLDGNDYIFGDVWWATDIGSKTFEWNLDAGNYIITVGGSGDERDRNGYWIDEIIAGENNNLNIHSGSYNLTISTTNDTWYNKQEKRLQGNFIEIIDNPTTTNEYKIYYNSESSLFVESTDDLTSAINKELRGIHNFQTLKIKGNSHVDFGGDKINVLDMSQSEFSADAVIEVGSLDQASIDYIASLPTANLTVTDDVYLDHLTLNSGNIKFEGAITAVNQVSINNVVNFKADNITASNIIIDSSTLSTKHLSATQDITIRNNSILTTEKPLSSDYNYAQVNSININSGGIVTLETGSNIDLKGKGMPAGKYFPEDVVWGGDYGRGCHGGKRFNETNKRCTYGDYRNAKFSGSGSNRSPSVGGGYLSITSNELILNGIINADGETVNTYGSAGGGVSIQATTITGLTTSKITVNGEGESGGGRISINTSGANTYEGDLFARGGLLNATSVAGAGTIFIQSSEYPNGYLTVENGLNNAQQSSTPLSYVGKHVITQAQRISPTEVKLHVGAENAVNINATANLAASGPESIHHYHFTLEHEREIRWLIESVDFKPTYYIFKIENGEYIDYGSDGDWLYAVEDYIFSLPEGDYVLAIGSSSWLDYFQAMDEINGNDPGPGGEYSLEINTLSGSTWLVDKAKYGWGLAGRSIDIDANDDIDKGYKVITNTEETITIEDASLTTADIDRINNINLPRKELVGLNTFDRLTIRDGAAVDFGDDRVVINSPQVTDFENFVQFSAGDINDSAVQILLNGVNSGLFEINSNVNLAETNLTQSNATINGNVNVNTGMTLTGSAKLTINGHLNVLGNLSAASDAFLSSKDISATSMLIDGATIEASNLNLTNDLTIIETSGSDSILTAIPATYVPNKIFPLNINVGNNIIVGANAEINVDGKGYPAYERLSNDRVHTQASGPDFNYDIGIGCHAGKVSTAITNSPCITYGRLEDPLFAGSAGYGDVTTPDNGGGIVKIVANSLNNGGVISANGVTGYWGGAGGSVNISVSSISGSGSFFANGGGGTENSSNSRSGGGGRVSLKLPNSSANGLLIDTLNSQLHARGGIHINPTYNPGKGGAGTIFIKYDDEMHGHLIVDNEGLAGPPNGTPIRQVGRRTLADRYIVASTGNPKYELSLGTNNSVHIEDRNTIEANGSGTIRKYPFSLTTTKTVDIKLLDGLHKYRLYLLEVNPDGSYTQKQTYNYWPPQYVTTRGVINASLPAGNYVVAVTGDTGAGIVEIENGIKTSGYTNTGEYKIIIDTQGDTWRASGGEYGWGLDGLRMSFTPDITPTAWDDATYLIISNTEESLVIESPTFDPEGLTDMTGVHVFETINIRGDAQVDFGSDMLFVKDILNSTLEAGSAITSSPNSVKPSIVVVPD